MSRPAIIFPDVEAWAVTYLTAALAAREESYAASVTVRTQAPSETGGDDWPTSGRLVTVRNDGGPRSDVTRTQSLGVNVWATAAPETANLANLVAAILDASPGSGSVIATLGMTGPYRVPEQSGRLHQYLSVDLVVTGTPLTA